jgi:hypothetical protein
VIIQGFAKGRERGGGEILAEKREERGKKKKGTLVN